MQVYQEDVGRQLAQAREGRGWSQEEVAARAGLGVATVSRVERGEVMGAHRSLLKMCDVLELSWPAVVTRAWGAQHGIEPVSVSRMSVREGGLIGVADAPCVVREGVLWHETSGVPLAASRWADMGRGRRCRVLRAGEGLWHVETEHVGCGEVEA